MEHRQSVRSIAATLVLLLHNMIDQRPVIGITSRLRQVESAFGSLPTDTVSRFYTDAVARAGGITMLLPPQPEANVGPLLDRVDGVVLTGGGDVAPHLYHRQDHDSVYEVDEERDRFEIAVAVTMATRRLPLLAVCRGIQILNVALGGDLVMDIDSEIPKPKVHREAEGTSVAMHPISVEPESSLAEVLHTTELIVNSSHHQAVRALGTGLRAVSWTEDGVVEAVESQNSDWPCLGVQWHPEFPEPKNVASTALFRFLVSQAARQQAADPAHDVEDFDARRR